MTLIPTRLQGGLLQPNRLSGGRIGGNARNAILSTASTATLAYISAVEAADGQQLELGVLQALVAFADYRIPLGGAAVVMAGARTLSGSLVPMVGEAPTNYNFVSGDYDRRTGTLGNGVNKYLNSNRNNNADGQDDFHCGTYVTKTQTTSTGVFIGTSGIGQGHSNLGHGLGAPPDVFARSRESIAGTRTPFTSYTGFAGHSRSLSSEFTLRCAEANSTHLMTSSTPVPDTIDIYRRGNASYANARLSYYSIGSNVDLAVMDTATTTLMNALDRFFTRQAFVYTSGDSFDIGTAGTLDFGVSPPDAVHLPSGSIM